MTKGWTGQRGEVVGERWVLTRRVGAGNFGCVWEALDGTAETEKRLYAVKTESRSHNSQLLKMEVMVLKRLNAAGAKHCCRLMARGRTERINYLVMTLTGPSLSQMRKRRGSVFDQSSACLITSQCLAALEELHQIAFVHRDVKPGNFAVDQEQKLIILLDFGLARCVVNSSGQRRKARPDAGFRGTLQYAPLAAHAGQEVGARDDLEALWYQHRSLSTPDGLPWKQLSDKAAMEQSKQESRRSRALYVDLPAPLQDFLEYLDSLLTPP